MQSMTLEQLRAASNAGGVSGVTLKGLGGAFLIQIDTRSGFGALLSKARSSEPRRFGNPLAALNVLRDIGITVGQLDASGYDPTDKIKPLAQYPELGRKGRHRACLSDCGNWSRTRTTTFFIVCRQRPAQSKF